MSNKPVILGGEPILPKPVPLTRPHVPRSALVVREFRRILSSGLITEGSCLKEFEERLYGYLGAEHVVAVSSCTKGLMLALNALNITGEVILPSFTFSATAAAVVWSGLRPVFVDCDPETFNADPAAVESAVTDETSAILAVHVFGNPAPVTELEQIATGHDLKLVFDAAHGFGSLYEGETLGSGGDAEVFSCIPTKLLVAAEGGVVATDNPQIAERVRTAREYGNPGNYDAWFAGSDGRMSEFHAALGMESLSSLERNAKKRNRLAGLYRERLGDLPGLRFQKVAAGSRGSFKYFAVAVDFREFGLTRDELALALTYEGIESRAYYDPPVHRLRDYSRYCAHGSDELPVTDKLSRCVICLPMSSVMTRAMVENISECVYRIHAYQHELRRHLCFQRLAA